MTFNNNNNFLDSGKINTLGNEIFLSFSPIEH